MNSGLRTQADYAYAKLIAQVLSADNKIQTRNHETYCLFNPRITAQEFTEFPLVTLRNTAAMKSLAEMAWFISGELKCPENLLDWWKGQLCPNGNLYFSYGWQFRQAPDSNGADCDQWFYLIETLKQHKNSRRAVISLWNTGDMLNICDENDNPNTPTNCHGTVIQANITKGKLNLEVYQRSADLLLGVPHNWTQYWAMLTFLAYHCEVEIGSLFWTFGDLHIYNEETHKQVCGDIFDYSLTRPTRADTQAIKLNYSYSGEKDNMNPNLPKFLASDFSFSKPENLTPVSTIRPKLL